MLLLDFGAGGQDSSPILMLYLLQNNVFRPIFLFVTFTFCNGTGGQDSSPGKPNLVKSEAKQATGKLQSLLKAKHDLKQLL